MGFKAERGAVGASRSATYSLMAVRALPQPRVRGWKRVASPIFISRLTGRRLASPTTSATSQFWNSDCFVRRRKCKTTLPSSILPVAKTCSEKISSNTIDGFGSVCPLSSSQWAVAFMTPSGLTSRGQA